MDFNLGVLELPYRFLLFFVILGHLFFAYGQWFKWPKLCEKLTNLVGDEIEKTAFLGRSFASYNFAIACGLLLSWLPSDNKLIQLVVLAFIVLTALVGAMGTKGNTILLMRFLPAAIALALLIFGLIAR